MTRKRIANRNQSDEISRDNYKKIHNVKKDNIRNRNMKIIENDDIKNKDMEQKYTVIVNETEIVDIDIVDDCTDKLLLSSPLPISTSFSTSIPIFTGDA